MCFTRNYWGWCKKILRSFLRKKYHRDEIQPSILVKVSDIISPVLSNIFNKCILSGVYPNILKRAHVVPIFKSVDSNMASNYRPISTISVFSKVFEKLIHSRLSDFQTTDNVTFDTQFRFRRKCNTTLAVFHLVANLIKSLQHKTYCICLCLDIRVKYLML